MIGGLGQVFNALGGVLHLTVESSRALIELLDGCGDVLQAGIDQFLLLAQLLTRMLLQFLEFTSGQLQELRLVFG